HSKFIRILGFELDKSCARSGGPFRARFRGGARKRKAAARSHGRGPIQVLFCRQALASSKGRQARRGKRQGRRDQGQGSRNQGQGSTKALDHWCDRALARECTPYLHRIERLSLRRYPFALIPGRPHAISGAAWLRTEPRRLVARGSRTSRTQ